LVQWRYVTPDDQWVAVSDKSIPSDSNWVFVERSAFADSRQGLAGMCSAQNLGHPQPATYKTHKKTWPPVCTLDGKTDD